MILLYIGVIGIKIISLLASDSILICDAHSWDLGLE